MLKQCKLQDSVLLLAEFDYLGCYPGTAADVYCGLPDPLYYRRSRKESNCDEYPSYMDCSIKEITGPCTPPTARMHCAFMNLLIETYHPYCNLESFNCSNYNYKKFFKDYEDEVFDDVEYKIYIFYYKFLTQLQFVTRFFYLSVFVAIFYSMFTKKSPLRNSFFILFLMVPFYDVLWLIFDALTRIPALMYQVDKVKYYLQSNRVDIMPVLLLPLCLNRYTAVTFPFKHNKVRFEERRE